MNWLVAYNPARLTETEMARFALDLMGDPYYRFLRVATPLLTVALGIALYCVGGWSWIVWGIAVRLTATYHVTWFVNSAAHASGYRNYDAGDISTNNWWVALLAWGEGWHNNHHAFPASARHGLHWFEFDATWITIRILERLGIASQVRLMAPQVLKRGPLLRRGTRIATDP